MPQAVAEHTDVRGFDAVFELVGATAYRNNLAMLARRGCLINHGQLSGELPTVDLTDLMDRGLFVTKFGGGAYLDALEDLVGLVAKALALAVEQPNVISDLGGRFPLSQAANAYQALESGVSGEVVITPDRKRDSLGGGPTMRLAVGVSAAGSTRRRAAPAPTRGHERLRDPLSADKLLEDFAHDHGDRYGPVLVPPPRDGEVYPSRHTNPTGLTGPETIAGVRGRS